ncbi:hypothetical protein V1264_024401 [Littorina saxatilis]|uniref:Fucolectin-related molecule n=1 Tax=Littorina saxatilis TaxID=31220 RepID=A0AAN9AMR0_9CAEN
MHNVAVNKTCTLSSYFYYTHKPRNPNDNDEYATYHENNTCHAANNGNTSTNYGKGNCIFTHWGDKNPNWTVNLGQSYVISKITVYARNTTNEYTYNSDHLKRMRGVMVAIDGGSVYTFDSDVKNIQPDTDIFLSPPRSGQEIKITRQNQVDEHYNYLSFCEVQVWVCDDEYYGTNCTTQCGNCKNGDPCDKSSGECPNGCQPGWSPQQQCDRPCRTGYHGDMCNDKCGRGCATQPCPNYVGCLECDPITGDCHCRDGWGSVGKCNGE